jgi:hypothetical protein
MGVGLTGCVNRLWGEGLYMVLPSEAGGLTCCLIITILLMLGDAYWWILSNLRLLYATASQEVQDNHPFI